MSRKGLWVTLAFAIGWSLPIVVARGENWAAGLFSERGHDFGLVPRGARVRHQFVLTNPLNESVTIVDLRPSCGCTSGRASTASVPAGQTAAIDAEMDTRNFVGEKVTTLYVTLATASGREAEVRLGVSATILSDIVLNPGAIDFGTVQRGQTAQRVLTIERLGVPKWEVERMLSACRAIDAEMVETTRTETTVQYALRVVLRPDAPAGPLRDEIRVLTNDRETPTIPILVTAQIRGELRASPSVLALGRVASANGAQGHVWIRGTRPFVVTGVEGAGGGFSITTDDTTPRPLHRLTIRYRPEEGGVRGDLARSFRLHTDLPGEPPVEVNASLHVDP